MLAMHGRLSPKPQPEEEVQQPSTPLVGSSWQQLPDGFLALALADEHSALSSRSSMSDGTAHLEGTGHTASPGMADDEDAAPELPVLHLQVHGGCRLRVASRACVACSAPAWRRPRAFQRCLRHLLKHGVALWRWTI